MLIFDQLKKNDPQLRLLTLAVSSGLFVLLAGLWWAQIVSARDYREDLATQSFHSVRIPAVRGKILDRTGVVLAENRPTYNVSLYLEELSKQFAAATAAETRRAKDQLAQKQREAEKKLGRKLRPEEETQFLLGAKEKGWIRQEARYEVASNVLQQISRVLQQPLALDSTNFGRHYETRLALPYPVVNNLNSAQIARFEERSAGAEGVDLDIQSTREYPYQTTAAHLLGHLQRDDSSAEGEEAFFSYRLPDYRGILGIEYGFDSQLRGHAGTKSVLVNNLGYRQTEYTWTPVEPGRNVVLTIDLRIQQAAENALQSAPVNYAPPRGAAVVMDVHTGDILALVSSPTYNPNYYVQGFPPGEYERLSALGAEKNRATQENYAPGSIFKPVVGLACLEAGLDPNATIYNPGFIYVGRRLIRDLAPPGNYNFRDAIVRSCNTYFITNGIKAGIENIVRLGQRLHFGERIGLPTHQETPGDFPSWAKIHSGWSEGDTANLCIGQGQIDVTPLQMAVMTAALANDGNVLWPRLVDRIESQDPASDAPEIVFPKGRVRDQLRVNQRNLQILKDAMLAEVEEQGTGRAAEVPGLPICGKTGTAEVKDAHNHVIDHTTWFISFAPYERPRYAVVVMVEGGDFGGTTCAPVARKIYEAILQCERTNALKTGPLVRAK